jgi:TonB family protein
MLACFAEKVRAAPPSYAASAAAYLRSYANVLVQADQLPKYTEAKVIDARSCMPKEYPERPRKEGAQGTTRLAYRVGINGKQTNVRVILSSGDTPMHKLLDFYAALSGTACKFTPAEENGKVVEGWAYVEVLWKLE